MAPQYTLLIDLWLIFWAYLMSDFGNDLGKEG